MATPRLPVLDKFIVDLRTIWAEDSENERRMGKAKPLLEQLLKDATLKAHSAGWPSTEGRKNLLLYVDPDHHFVINAVVRMPGRTGSVHDHADAWVLYGVLDGSESLERFERVDDGSRSGYAEVRLSSVTTGTQGKVDLVSILDTMEAAGHPANIMVELDRNANAPMSARETGDISKAFLVKQGYKFRT